MRIVGIMSSMSSMRTVRAGAVLVIGTTLLVALASCGATSFLSATGTPGSGNLKTETRSVQNFSAVSLSGAGTMTITQTGTESLTIQAEDNVLPLITSNVSGNVLTIGIQPTALVRPTKGITYTLTVKNLSAISLLGAATIDARNITTNALTVKLTGAGKMTISGQTQSQAVTISGAGTYQADTFTSSATTVTITGVGSASVNVSITLNAHINGAGNITYTGNPTVTKSISGAGAVNKK